MHRSSPRIHNTTTELESGSQRVTERIRPIPIEKDGMIFVLRPFPYVLACGSGTHARISTPSVQRIEMRLDSEVPPPAHSSTAAPGKFQKLDLSMSRCGG